MLREDLDLTGTKHGCELGECGACAVLVDGEPELSCLVLALECDGRAIETVEGLASGAELHPLQAAFADLGAAQCGYCTPGILMTAKALLEKGTLTHPRKNQGSDLRQSVPLHRLPADLRGDRGSRQENERMKVLGKPRRRVDGRAKVTGQTRFADDVVLPRMLHMRLLRSPHPHADRSRDRRREGSSVSRACTSC